MNGFWILLNAIKFVVPSSSVLITETVPVDRRFVIISQEARAATPAVPSLSSAIPTPTPIAKRIAILSIRAPPALTRKNPICSTIPVMSPPCIVAEQSAYPIPIRIPQIGRQATGSIRALPNFCKNFIIFLLLKNLSLLNPFYLF